MKKQTLLKKTAILALPAIMICAISFGQSDNAKKPGDKLQAATTKTKSELAQKHQANRTVYKNNSSTERSCIKPDAKKANIVTQSMLKKMPKDRQEFVKANPQRFTIVNN
jgi:hypothetical protein